MKKRTAIIIFVILIIIFVLAGIFLYKYLRPEVLPSPTSQAGPVSEAGVFKTSASISENPPKIIIDLSESRSADNIYIYRRNYTEIEYETPLPLNWGAPIANVQSSAGYWTDTNVTIGKAYEYVIAQQRGDIIAYGFLLSGIKIPVRENRGKIILLVHDVLAAPLYSELNRLKMDLIGDGWQVIRIDISITKPAWQVRELIKQEYNKYDDVKAVFVVGNVAVPHSGWVMPDGHTSHLGDYPADLYYGEMDGPWTDTINYGQGGEDTQSNYAWDGKQDQSEFPSDIDLMVGRVDLSNMPSFGNGIDSMKRYLDKDHAFRIKQTIVPEKVLIDDNYPLTLPFVASGLRLSSVVGVGNIITGEWPGLCTMPGAFLWADGQSGGRYYGWKDIATTYTYASCVYKSIFNIMTGSMFGEWDTQDSFLRAPLENPIFGLTNVWVAWSPGWYFHRMGLGEPIGSALFFRQGASIVPSLMGDPTLRLKYVAPASNLTGVKSRGSVNLSWSASSDNVSGYYIYRAAKIDGHYTRIANDFITSTSYTDTKPDDEEIYMVRAVALITSASGSYYNPSQGIFFNSSGARQTCNENQICDSEESKESCPEDCQCLSSSDCFDSNVCTTDSCINSRCSYVNNQNTCNDNYPCTINDACSGGACVGTRKNCNDNESCTIDSCVNGFCEFVFNSSDLCSCEENADCFDNNYCTTDSCINHVCAASYNNDSCDDNNPCTVNDACSQGGCSGMQKSCDDGISCTDDFCLNGNCTHFTLHCECNNNSDCEDDNLCTDNFCSPAAKTCVQEFNSVACDDNNPGTLNDTCSEGVCTGKDICNTNSLCENSRGENCANCAEDCGSCFISSNINLNNSVNNLINLTVSNSGQRNRTFEFPRRINSGNTNYFNNVSGDNQGLIARIKENWTYGLFIAAVIIVLGLIIILAISFIKMLIKKKN